jgi:DNA-binding LacI/PurR family transcriptional regulator
LTTVHSPIEQVAYQATDLLIRSIAGERVPAETRLPTRLVVRSSCGCSW